MLENDPQLFSFDSLVDVYNSARQSKYLNALQLIRLIKWTSDLELSVESVESLADKFTLVSCNSVVLKAAFEKRRAGASFGKLALLKALYAAAPD